MADPMAGLVLERDTIKHPTGLRHWARYVNPRTLERYGGAYADTPEEAEQAARLIWLSNSPRAQEVGE